MTDDKTQAWLESLSLDELDKVQALVEKKAAEKRQSEDSKRKHLSLRSAPNEIADAYGLDITGLMRDIEKWK